MELIEFLLLRILAEDKNIMAAIDDLTQEVADSETVQDSAIALINGLAAQVTAAGTDPAKLAALTQSLKTKADALAAAVSANTAASPLATSPANPAIVAAATEAAQAK